MADYYQVKNQNIFTPPANISLGNTSNQYSNVYVQNNLVVGNVTVTSSTIIAPRVTTITYPGNDTAADPAGGQTITLTGSGFVVSASILINSIAVSVVSVVSSTIITFTSPANSSGSYVIYVVNPDGSTAIAVPGIQYSGIPTWTTAAGTLGSLYETASFTESVVATGDAPITYSVASGTLPPGATFNGNGTITGTSQLTASPTTYTFIVSATDAEQQDTNRSFSLTINTDVVTWTTPAANSTTTLGQNVASTTTLLATSAAGKAITYTANALPTGLSISGATVTGTPTVVGNTSSLFTATAATTGRTTTATINWTISVSGDTYLMYTSLLLSGGTSTSTFIADTSTNNFALAIAGDTKPNNFNPYTPGYYSNYFDGTGDYLSTTVNLAIATGSFTMEAWVYLTALGSERTILNNLYWQSGNNGGWILLTDTSNRLWLRASTNTFNSRTTVILSSSTLAANIWYHVAVVRDSNNLVSMYFNGVSAATSVTYAASLNQGTGQLFRIGAWNPDGGSQDFWSGYISNARVVVGTAVYTGTFTPSTTPLTAIANTSLLTCQSNRFLDNSTNAYAITKVGDTTVRPTTPFVPDSTYATQGGTYFDGTGDYLTIPDSGAFTIGTNDFTFECWVYPTVITSGNNNILAQWGNGNAFIFKYIAAGRLRFEGGGGASGVSGTTTAVTVNQWNHVAITRSSSTVRLFVNGVMDATSATIGALTDGASVVAIGAYTDGSGEFVTGYISNLRLLNGTALYTTTFTPPTAPLTASTNTVLLTCQTNQPANNSVFLDNSTNTFAVTRVGNTTQGTFTPYGANWSNYFDGNSDWLQLSNNSAFLFGSGNFTLECWLFSNTVTSGDQVLMSVWDDASTVPQAWDFRVNGSGKVFFQIDVAGADTSIFTSTATLSAGQWYHLAVTRSGNTFRLFINGTLDSTTTNSSTISNGNGPLCVGGYTGSGQADKESVNGYLSNVRIVKGTAVYTAAFTPPSTPLTAITNTSLLTCQSNRLIDNSTNAFAITKNGDVAVQRFSPFSPSAAYSTSTIGGSAYFDGNGDYLSIPYSTSISQTSSYTLEFWFYPIYDYVNQYIFAQNGGGAFALNWTGTVMKVDKNGVGIQITGTTTLGLNQWHHYAMTYDGTTTRVFANGALDGSVAGTGGLANVPTTIGYYTALGTSSYKGYLSNFRFVKGVAVYTGTFTPSTTPLTAITNTSLLLNMTSAGIYDSTMINDLETVGDAKILSTQTPYAGSYYSNYFDGTGDYLTVPSNAAFAFGTGDYTFECWINTNSTAQQVLFGSGGTGTNNFYFNFSPTSSFIGVGTQLAYVLQATSLSLLTGVWYHVAASRSSGTLKLFLNGAQVASGADSTTWIQGGSPAIGSNAASGQYTNGYISNLRVVNGVAVYTGTFTPPTAPLTATQSSGTNISAITGTATSLLTCQSNRFVDNSTNAFAVTRTGDTSVQSFNPFQRNSAATMYFDGTGDWLVPRNLLPLGSGNFTVEMWLYPNATYSGAYAGILDSRTSGDGVGLVYFGYTGTANQIGWKDNTTNVVTGSVTLSTWNHVAIARSNGTMTMYVNGTSTSSSANSTNYTVAFRLIGASFDPLAFNGYINDLRITNGVARYTSTFTPPTSAFLTT